MRREAIGRGSRPRRRRRRGRARTRRSSRGRRRTVRPARRCPGSRPPSRRAAEPVDWRVPRLLGRRRCTCSVGLLEQRERPCSTRRMRAIRVGSRRREAAVGARLSLKKRDGGVEVGDLIDRRSIRCARASTRYPRPRRCFRRDREGKGRVAGAVHRGRGRCSVLAKACLLRRLPRTRRRADARVPTKPT